ncbi:MAG: ribosomal protein S18-alanine N-acetyltransferase [Lachnospiraceae bacterium]
MIKIRPMEERDIKGVVEIETASFSQPWSAKGFSDSLSCKETIYVVAEEGDRIMGYCGIYTGSDQGEIPNVAVRKECRNGGIGRQMLVELLHLAKRRGIRSICLEVRISNQSAIHLYESLGFERVGIRKDFYEQPKEDGMIMIKEEKIRCQCCGKMARFENGLMKDDFLHIEKEWGYFSKKDGTHHEFNVCEECYDKWVAEFVQSPENEESLELL